MVLKTAYFFKKMRFEVQREQLTKQRRIALQQGNMVMYKTVATEMNTKEEACLNEILAHLLKKLKVDENTF